MGNPSLLSAGKIPREDFGGERVERKGRAADPATAAPSRRVEILAHGRHGHHRRRDVVRRDSHGAKRGGVGETLNVISVSNP